MTSGSRTLHQVFIFNFSALCPAVSQRQAFSLASSLPYLHYRLPILTWFLGAPNTDKMAFPASPGAQNEHCPQADLLNALSA